MRTSLGFKILILVAVATVGIVSLAQADTLTWTLVGVTSLGTSITGSFDYNADTQTYSSIDITTSGGTVIPSMTWTVESVAVQGSPWALYLVNSSAADETGDALFGLTFYNPLTDAGGTIGFDYTIEGICADSACTEAYPDNPYTNTAVTGDVVASASVPEPGTLMLLATGLLGLSGAVKRKVF